MKRVAFWAALAIVFTVAAGCGHRRVAPYAPRMPDVKEHKGQTSDEDCLDCHALASLPDHSVSDSCLDCHRVIPGR
ncbi:hypothetical protein FDZ71_04095 [bacterium]|nr:MAG: hypothetical protein FDZ71_04095 [bacterium]